ncbi:hypothetical protein C7972_105151 [Arenibacter sp. ARW7G5Y1]|nr:hypothetical protein C7972_105151 [Arenibacter sp. ARW7G5Y1]
MGKPVFISYFSLEASINDDYFFITWSNNPPR